MGGQEIGQVVDYRTPPGQQGDPNAIISTETSRSGSIPNSEAQAKRAEEGGPMPQELEEQRRDLYRL